MVDSHSSDALALGAPVCLGIAHRGCHDLELVPPDLLRDADGHPLALNYAAAHREEIEARVDANDRALAQAEHLAGERQRLLA